MQLWIEINVTLKKHTELIPGSHMQQVHKVTFVTGLGKGSV